MGGGVKVKVWHRATDPQTVEAFVCQVAQAWQRGGTRWPLTRPLPWRTGGQRGWKTKNERQSWLEERGLDGGRGDSATGVGAA